MKFLWLIRHWISILKKSTPKIKDEQARELVCFLDRKGADDWLEMQ
uniref:Uncharacterized protein n=1 Tax=Siphoviridae sp. ctM4P7 TaxID=2826256 RepID=A0A8S5MXU1_9CAUD|nr:MAG TPA: hypothetical protein [Siphoviridae sp. ctM4P7]